MEIDDEIMKSIESLSTERIKVETHRSMSFFVGHKFFDIIAHDKVTNTIMALGYVAYSTQDQVMEVSFGDCRNIIEIDSQADVKRIIKETAIGINSINRLKEFTNIYKIFIDNIAMDYTNYAEIETPDGEGYYAPAFINSENNTNTFPTTEELMESIRNHGLDVCGTKLPWFSMSTMEISNELIRNSDGLFYHAGTKFGRNSFVGILTQNLKNNDVRATGFIGTPKGTFFVINVPFDILQLPPKELARHENVMVVEALDKSYPFDVFFDANQKAFALKIADKLVPFRNLHEIDTYIAEEFSIV